MTNPPSDQQVKDAIRTLAVVRGLASQIQTRLFDVSRWAGDAPTPLPFKDTGKTMLTGEACFEIQLITNHIQDKLLDLTNALRVLVDMDQVQMTDGHRAFTEMWDELLIETRKELFADRAA